jgi:AcrR family transcriptional regulator
VADAVRKLTEQGKERKQQLLECAAALFAERGYAETRVVDIVDAAGVAKGLFYWYFENKEAVFRELVHATRQRLRRSQADAIDPRADPLTRLRQGTEASVRFMAEHAHLYALMQAEGLDRQVADLMREGTELHVRDTAATIRAGIIAGLVRDEDPVTLAYGVIGVVANYSHFHRTRRVELDIDQLADVVGRFVVHAVAVDDDAARLALEAPAGRTSFRQAANTHTKEPIRGEVPLPQR